MLALTGAFAVFRLDSMKRELGARIRKVIEIMNVDTNRPLLMEGLPEQEASDFYQDFRTHEITQLPSKRRPLPWRMRFGKRNNTKLTEKNLWRIHTLSS